jgi:hypothetical protein
MRPCTLVAAAVLLLLVGRWDAFDPNGSASLDSTETLTTGLTWFIRGQDMKLQAHWMDVRGPGSSGEGSKAILRFQLAF